MTNRLYLDNPYLREIDSRIVDKIYKDGKYYIKLNRTIFYPHLSGGQPGDKGTINGVQVLEVYEEDSDIIHVTKENIYSDKVILNIDWENRFDNMQQHTGQHLLSAAFYKLYNGETVGFHIGKDYVYIDITLPDLSEDDSEKIEIYANRIIFSNFEIKSYYIEKNDINKLPIRKQPTVNSNIRIVEIDNIDFSPCAGTHLRNTGEIGLIKIRKWEKYKGNIRIEFVCGNRALFDYRWKSKMIKDISLLLSSKDTDVLEKVKILYNQKEDLEKNNRNIQEELLRYKGEDLLKNAIKIDGISFVTKIFDDRDLKTINKISVHLNNIEKSIQIYGSKYENKGQFLISVSKDLNINLKDIFKEVSEEFEIKGGGSPQTIQGGCSLDDLDSLLNIFFENIKNKIKG
ncbi:alanyl-tRNA synthetase [Tissierella praeacuta DSM 18095]|uniref:Alanyl-tRNA synthetase n=1 Tax=Tissierella praeacuta DSM 18095 TaxID=1123404 RepID=A0A1M4S7Z4_9FIRM|nr:DHHA1 domain-containing protein [Tissierella praeacuta]SHE28288.1 alanyl-tRNA synthetase [Tissierella praeacuta DSM 18095]SUP01075.1 Alanine--tRNA ligase [Tissierella praeacuta]